MPLQRFCLKFLLGSIHMHEVKKTIFFSFSFSWFFFSFANYFGGGICGCTNLFWTLHIIICQSHICFLLSKVTNQSHLISRPKLFHIIREYYYVDTITSTKEYDSHALDPLTDKFNKQVSSLQKQSSVHIFFIGTGIVLCMRHQDGQEWQQAGPHSLSHILCLTPWLKAIFHHRTLSCDNVRSS